MTILCDSSGDFLNQSDCLVQVVCHRQHAITVIAIDLAQMLLMRVVLGSVSHNVQSLLPVISGMFRIEGIDLKVW
jgi:hypothetical protein